MSTHLSKETQRLRVFWDLQRASFKKIHSLWDRAFRFKGKLVDLFIYKGSSCGICYHLQSMSFKHAEAHVFFEDMFEAEQTGKTKKILKLFSEADLLIIDDLFLRKKMPSDAADYLLDIIINRYSKRKSTVITSNRPI